MLFMLTFFLMISAVNAATIQGTVYDWELNPIDKAVIEINTTPRQTIVAAAGDYSVELDLGSYSIKATDREGNEEIETVNVVKEGTYNLDIIMFPSFDDPEKIFNDSEFNPDQEISEDVLEETPITNYLIWGVALLIIIGLVISSLSRFKRGETEIKKEVTELKQEVKKKEVDPELSKIVEAIKNSGGRTTQKELRKQFPSSEAKISLMITELEKKGIIEKIKKGRGNILVLK